jgi:hypothetical protein
MGSHLSRVGLIATVLASHYWHYLQKLKLLWLECRSRSLATTTAPQYGKQ